MKWSELHWADDPDEIGMRWRRTFIRANDGCTYVLTMWNDGDNWIDSLDPNKDDPKYGMWLDVLELAIYRG